MKPEGAVDKIIFLAKAGDDAVRQACAAVQASLPVGASPRLQSEGIIHATLIMAGWADDPRTEPTALETAALIRASALDLVFDTLEVFGGADGVMALTCSARPPEWTALRNQLSSVPRRLGLTKVGGASPHLTMAYSCPPMPKIRLSDPVVWNVDRFVLVRSLYGKAEHVPLGEWRLG